MHMKEAFEHTYIVLIDNKTRNDGFLDLRR